MEPKSRILPDIIVILIISFFAFFINNHVIPADLMESRNLATAQEMVRTGNYIAPTLNGEPRFEKPPLPTWIAAGMELIIPGNLVAQRCAAGMAATLLVLFLYLLILRLAHDRKPALISALVLATCFNLVLMGRTATWDVYCHAFMLGGIFFISRAFLKGGSQWGNFAAAGLFVGLSFLGKGPVAFYATLLPFIIAFIWVYRPGFEGKRKILPFLLMVVLALLVAFWWPVYLYLTHPEVAAAVAQKESSSWLNHNVRPWYYYWQFPAEAGIWAVFLVTSLVSFFVTWRPEFRREQKFFTIWFLVAIILLSLIPEKKTRYLLPILIPGAACIGFYIYKCAKGMQSRGERFWFRFNSLIVGIVILGLPAALYFIFFRDGQIGLFTQILSTLVCLGLAYMIFSALGSKNRPIRVMQVFVSVVLSMVFIEAVCLMPFGKMFINDDRHSIRMIREMPELDEYKLYYNPVEELRMELVYEANKTILPLSLADTVRVYTKMPFVFVSGADFEEVFNGYSVDVEFIDEFDNNWRKTGHKRYNPALVRKAAIIKKCVVDLSPEEDSEDAVVK